MLVLSLTSDIMLSLYWVTLAVKGNNMHINAGTEGLVQAKQFKSTVAQGAAPLTVVSTTKVTNLNADLLDGMTATSAATANTIMARDVVQILRLIN